MSINLITIFQSEKIFIFTEITNISFAQKKYILFETKQLI